MGIELATRLASLCSEIDRARLDSVGEGVPPELLTTD
jgi:hypothetical protein